MNDGYGSCNRCGASWKNVQHHSTYYGPSGVGVVQKGLFPLCETCWSDLTPETRVEFYRRLWCNWQQWPDPTRGDEEWEQIKTAVEAGG